MISRPHQITDSHLRRRAIVYVRQSSLEQVRVNIGSTAVQRDLTQKLEASGWLPPIEVVDDDLGVSGSRAGARDGFNHLLERMKAGEIGLVAVVDASRLSRNVIDLGRFFDLAQRHEVLLAQGDQVIDFNDPEREKWRRTICRRCRLSPWIHTTGGALRGGPTTARPPSARR